MKTLVLGLGNPVLGDDGVGWRIAEQIKQQVFDPSVEVDCVGLGGLSLMERLVGYDRAILIDAIATGEPPGTVRLFRLEDLPDPTAGHTSSSHDTTLQTALQLGRRVEAQVPDQVMVVAVEARNVYDFSEELSQPIEAAVPQAVQIVLRILEQRSWKEEK